MRLSCELVLCTQNILIKEADGRMVAVVADFGLATKIPDPLYVVYVILMTLHSFPISSLLSVDLIVHCLVFVTKIH